MSPRRAWMAAMLALAAAGAQAADVRREIYKCQQDGKLIYSNEPCGSAALRKDGRIDNKPLIAIGRNNGSARPSVDWGDRAEALSAMRSGSAGAIDWNDTAAIVRAVTATRDDTRKMTIYEAPVLTQQPSDKLFLRCFVPDNQPPLLTQLYVRSVFSGQWRGYASARDAQGSKLDLVRIDTDTDCSGAQGCALAEDVGVNLLREYLERAQYSGIELQISGPGGRQDYRLPANYVQAFLLAVPVKGSQPVVGAQAGAVAP